ncbi:hypothetical protein [Maribacter aquivivus]|nr:hypothetical protein [Maribacter aquivivus]
MLEEEVNYAQLQLNGEISKLDNNLTLEGCGYDGDNEFIIEKLGRRLRVIPDLVLHKSQNYREFDGQKVIVEIKTGDDNPTHDIFDLIKLLNFVEQLNFENAIFVAVNKDRQQLSNDIKKSFENLGKESYSKCSIIFYTGVDLNNDNLLHPKVFFKSIEEIINNR